MIHFFFFFFATKRLDKGSSERLICAPNRKIDCDLETIG